MIARRIARLPVIRHARFIWLSWRVRHHARVWGNLGIGLGIPNPADLDHLEAIWKGEA